MKLSQFALALILPLALFLVPSGQAGLFGTPDDSGEGEVELDILTQRSTRRFTVIDNTFMGLGDPKGLRDFFEENGWEAEYSEDTFVSEFYKILQNTDVLLIITHGGVRESTQQVGFVWRTLFGLNKNVITADEVALEMEGMPHPALVVVAGCKSTHNDTMAKAMGGAFIGFDRNVDPGTASKYSRDLLEKVAKGMSYREAFRTTRPPQSIFNTSGAQPKMFEPEIEEQ